MAHRRAFPARTRGFTLVELALVTVIGSMLIVAVVMPLAMQMEVKRFSQTRENLDDIKSSLLGFATVNGYFPCPDTDNDGLENRTVVGLGSTCAGIASGVATGVLPWVTLGIGDHDAWDHRYRYAVTREFAERNSSGVGFSASTAGSMQICSTVPAPCVAANRVATAVPIVIMSFGPNGRGATTLTGATTPTTGITAEETENLGGNVTAYVSHAVSPDASSSGEFDDIVSWLPTSLIMSRMTSVTSDTSVNRAANTREDIEDIQSALLGYALVNGYFPCPDTDNDGAENRTPAGSTSNCAGVSGTVATGHVPWTTIGMGFSDSWGNRYRYAVTRTYAEEGGGGSTFTMGTQGTLQICATAPAPCVGPNRIADAIPVVVMSFGANGMGATTSSGTTVPTAGITAEETENLGGNVTAYVSHAISASPAATGEYDDIVGWLSGPFIKNRMVAAGQLP